MITSAPDGVLIDVHVLPRASRAGLAGTRGDAVLVRLNAPPVDGAANDELVGIVAGALDVPRRSVTIVRGQRARKKRVHVAGIDPATAAARLRT
jgi:hypothetical protein